MLRPSDRSRGAAEIPYLHRLWTPPPRASFDRTIATHLDTLHITHTYTRIDPAALSVLGRSDGALQNKLDSIKCFQVVIRLTGANVRNASRPVTS